jgi:hypothetical protein
VVAVRLSPLDRLAAGLRRPPHEYRPTLQVFPDFSVDVLARELQVVERGKINGSANQPPSGSSSTLDEVEHEILERIFSERKGAHQSLIDQLDTYAQRLNALDFHGRFTTIQHAAPDAVAEFRAEARKGRDELYQLRRALVENERERDTFRQRQRLLRAPRISSTPTTALKIAFLLFLFVSETYINGIFLAKGNELGIIGGTAEALVFAVLNVAISFFLGLGGVRQLNHSTVTRKSIGAMCLLFWVAFTILLNLALAHYREISGALYEDAGARVIARLSQQPFGLTDIKSWMFFGIGVVFSVAALTDGILFTDPYPGYASLERRVQRAHQNYIDRKTDLIAELKDIRDDATEEMQAAQADLQRGGQSMSPSSKVVLGS